MSTNIILIASAIVLPGIVIGLCAYAIGLAHGFAAACDTTPPAMSDEADLPPLDPKITRI